LVPHVSVYMSDGTDVTEKLVVEQQLQHEQVA
jgi:hypothetical protein